MKEIVNFIVSCSDILFDNPSALDFLFTVILFHAIICVLIIISLGGLYGDFKWIFAMIDLFFPNALKKQKR